MKFKKFCLILLVISLLHTGCSQSSDSQDKEVNENSKVTFLAVGDNLMHEKLIEEAHTNDSYSFLPYYQNVSSYIQNADISFINQETILGGKDKGYSGYPLFNTPDEMAKDLYEVGFDVVNGATNHAYDQGLDGIHHSIQVFSQYPDMHYIGLYQSQEERDAITVIEKQGIRIAFLSYNQVMNYQDTPPSYTYNPFDKELMKNDVKKAKELSDIVIVSCHWGVEYDSHPQPFQKKYAQYLADLGVDVIIGTHPHSLQPVEWINGQNGHKTLVAYSLGNFLSGSVDEDAQLGGMLSCDFIKKGDQITIENVTLTPVVNYYLSSSPQSIMTTRHDFQVYLLKDCTDELIQSHGLNGYQNINLTIDKFKKTVRERISSDISIDM